MVPRSSHLNLHVTKLENGHIYSEIHACLYCTYFLIFSGCSKLLLIFRYIQHKTDFESLPDTRPILVPCRVSGCKCKSYNFVPKNGSQPIRCQCKHFADDHSEAASHKCLKGCGCKKFISSFTCGCGQPTHAHKVN